MKWAEVRKQLTRTAYYNVHTNELYNAYGSWLDDIWYYFEPWQIALFKEEVKYYNEGATYFCKDGRGIMLVKIDENHIFTGR